MSRAPGFKNAILTQRSDLLASENEKGHAGDQGLDDIMSEARLARIQEAQARDGLDLTADPERGRSGSRERERERGRLEWFSGPGLV